MEDKWVSDSHPFKHPEPHLLLFLLFVLLLSLNPCGSVDVDPVDKASLLAFRSWVQDPSQSLVTWSGSDCTNWTGVTCSSSSGRVLSLNLTRMNLSGKIHPNLCTVSRLKSLALSWNNLAGSIPPCLGSLRSLEVLDLSHDQLTGALPETVSRLGNLKQLTLNGNQGLGGLIPPWIGNFSVELERLDLSFNSFVGEVPDSLLYSKSLRYLNFEENKLSGELRDFHQQLEILNLGSNSFSGTLPCFSASAKSLKVLNLGNNSIVGGIPTCIASLEALTHLNLSFNHLSYKLSPGLVFSEKLLVLDLSNNDLVGSLPGKIAKATEKGLILLDLSHNQFSGEISSKITELKSLQALFLSHNLLTGEIPSRIGNLTYLQVIDLSHNALSDPVPLNILHADLEDGFRLLPFYRSSLGYGSMLKRKLQYVVHPPQRLQTPIGTMSTCRSSDPQLWSWGAGTDGQLCTGSLRDELLPQPLSLPSVSHLACGGAHVVALTSGGKVFTWGRGSSGQIGQGEIVSHCLKPKAVAFPESFSIADVSAGWSHSGFVSDTGRLFTCGDGSFGQLGHGDFSSHCYPAEVSYFASKQVGQIACGMRHSLVLLKGGIHNELYGFGSCKRGQIGAFDWRTKLVSLPRVVDGFEDIEIVSISANGDHSAAISTDGSVYHWGRGFPGSSDNHSPARLDSSSWIKQVALGWNHALILTESGEISMLGGRHHGNLSDLAKTGVNEATDRREAFPATVPALDGVKVVDVASGAEHSTLVTEDGTVKTWGWGEHGQLGLGDTRDQVLPQEVILNQADPAVEQNAEHIVEVASLMP